LGTNNSSQIEQLQKEIKDLLKKMGISQAKFIKKISDLSEEEVRPEVEKFKKHLQRKTTKIDILKKYLKDICELSEYEKLNKVKLRSKLKDGKNLFSEFFEKEMKKISEHIDEKIEEAKEI
jgi:hypothetical protein